MCYISIHFLYTEEDLYGPIVFQDRFLISIHFLYTEEDSIPHRQGKPLLHFNPLPLYRGRQRKGGAYGPDGKFQSTSSIQRKTVIKEVGTVWGIKFQSTSSIQRKTQSGLNVHLVFSFQSTSSRQRKTAFRLFSSLIIASFQSTSSIQRKTDLAGCLAVILHVFQSTSSIQRKTIRLRLSPNHVTIFQSTSSIQRKTNSDSLSVI